MVLHFTVFKSSVITKFMHKKQEENFQLVGLNRSLFTKG